jgi:putative component of membrane protein insertase Oxa1/YidC/SpoIIIJ protein YidD
MPNNLILVDLVTLKYSVKGTNYETSLIMKLLPSFCHFFPLSSKYSFQHLYERFLTVTLLMYNKTKIHEV